MTPPGPGIYFGIDPRALSKFVLVPPGASERLLAVLRAQSDTKELPAIGGMPVIVSRHCPPDTAYFLQASEEIPEIRPAPNHWADVWDEVEEPVGLGLTFSIDYLPAVIQYRPRPIPPWGWRQKFRWRLWWWKVRILGWWHRLRWESRSPFED